MTARLKDKFFKGSSSWHRRVRIKADRGFDQTFGMLGETKTIQGIIKDINITKQEAIIDS